MRQPPVVVARVNIEIAAGVFRELVIRRGDDPKEVAQLFCMDSNLPTTIAPVLVRVKRRPARS